MTDLLKTNKSALESATLFLNALDMYTTEEQTKKARDLYKRVASDKRISIEKRNNILQQLKRVTKNPLTSL